MSHFYLIRIYRCSSAAINSGYSRLLPTSAESFIELHDTEQFI